MIGAFDSAIACIIDPLEGCETSTMMPHLFISAITCLPSGLRPPHIHWLFASPVFESASWLWPLCASDMYRPPFCQNSFTRLMSIPIG